MRHRSILVTVLLFVSFFSFRPSSFADGFYVPELYVKLPDIPVQRALIKYRDGLETLIVESTLDGPGQKFGWIIPVPSVPQRFEKITPGVLKTLSVSLQPRLTDHRPRSREGAFLRSLLTFLFSAWALAMILKCRSIMRKGCSSFWSIIKFDIWLAIIMFVGAPIFIMFVNTFFAVYGSSGPLPPPTTVRVESRQAVGDYEISVVTAQKSSDLNNWLEDNGYRSFPDRAVPAVDDYIGKNWAFVAAKIIREGEGTATPHPILIEFKTDRPVYPMRLTALSDSAVNLELFVLGAEEAVPVGYDLKKKYCDYFDYEPSNSFYRFGKENIPLYMARAKENYGGFADTIGHPYAMKLMWNGCVLTKLAGEVSSEQMKEDMFFSLKRAAPYRYHVYGSRWVIERGLIVAIVIGLFGLQGLCLLYQTRERVSPLLLPGLLIVCLAIFFAIYFSFEKVEATSQFTGGDLFSLRIEIEAFMADHGYKISDLPDGEIGAYLDEHATWMKNILTKETVAVEDSPGNITWERKYGELFFTIYLPNGTPHHEYPSLNDFREEDLIAALNDEFSEIRYEAARVLGDRKDPRAVDALVAALEDENWRVRFKAASSLWETNKDSRAIELLITALKDPDSRVRSTAAKSLGEIIESLITALKDPDSRVRSTAAKSLDAIKEHGTVEYLIAALKDPDFQVRAYAVWALGRIKSHRAIAPLRSAFRDGDSYVQWAAARALGAIDQPQAVEALIDGLRDVDPSKRSTAAEAFNKTKDPRAVETLITVLNDEVWWVRRSAAKALGKIGDHKAVEPLYATLKDGNEQVRMEAARALGQMNEIELLINALQHGEDTERECAAKALGSIKADRAIDHLIAALEDDSPFVRNASSVALKRLTGINPDREPAKWQHWLEKNKVKLKH